MNSINNRNINFMVFESLDVIENYLSSEIVKYIRSQPKLNLSIESRTDFYNLLNKLKDDFLSNRVSFRNVNFFMTDDYIFDTQSWENFAPQSSQEILKNIFFSQVDFDESNLHPILNEIRFREFNKNIFINYDSEIDAADGLDVIVLKMQPDGSLIFNDVVDSGSLSSKGIPLNANIKANILGEFGGVQESLPVSCATLGIDQILKARKVFIVGFGADVANTLQKLFYTKDYDKTVPTCLLKSHPNVTVLVDKEASAGIFTPSKTQYISKLVETIVEPISPNENITIAPSLEETEVYVDEIDAAQEVMEPVQELVEETIVYEQEPVQEMVNQAIEIDIQDPEQQQNESLIDDNLESELENEYDFDSLNDFQDID
ncbi:MAG: hypothetical protein K2H56_02795 [Malacoplasma sp.]|nr:hypothetical protein [Malacoplasma sp.]MDE5775061.1 hypothetical protein [Malacoplasma sp.]